MGGTKRGYTGILREGQKWEGGRRGKGWDEECRECKREVRKELKRWRKLGGGGKRYIIMRYSLKKALLVS